MGSTLRNGPNEVKNALVQGAIHTLVRQRQVSTIELPDLVILGVFRKHHVQRSGLGVRRISCYRKRCDESQALDRIHFKHTYMH